MQHNSIFTGIFNGSDTSIIGKHCGWWDVHPPTYLNKSYDSSQIRPIAELLLLEEYTWVRRKSVGRNQIPLQKMYYVSVWCPAICD